MKAMSSHHTIMKYAKNMITSILLKTVRLVQRKNYWEGATAPNLFNLGIAAAIF